MNVLFADHWLRTLLHICPEYLSPSDYQTLVLSIDTQKLKLLLKCRDKFQMTPLHCLILQLDPEEENKDLKDMRVLSTVKSTNRRNSIFPRTKKTWNFLYFCSSIPDLFLS